MLDVNLKGVVPDEQGGRPGDDEAALGVIVNLSSVVGRRGNAGQANYSAAKAGLIGLTKTLARELASRNVRVNAVAPGYIQTEMTAGPLRRRARATIAGNTPLNRMGTPEDVAAGRRVPGERRGRLHHGRRAAGRRRAGHLGGRRWRHERHDACDVRDDAPARVVVTGIGVVSPVGLGQGESLLGPARAAARACGPITRFDTTGYAVTIAAEVEGFDPLDFMDKQGRQADGPLRPVRRGGGA